MDSKMEREMETEMIRSHRNPSAKSFPKGLFIGRRRTHGLGFRVQGLGSGGGN